MSLDYEAWRCTSRDTFNGSAGGQSVFCPPGGCSVADGCARDKGWTPERGWPWPGPNATYDPVPDDQLQAIIESGGGGLPAAAIVASQVHLAGKLLEAQAELRRLRSVESSS